MGCCAVRTNDIMDEAFSSKVIKTIKDNLEANLVNQSMLNMDLDNKRKKFENKNDKITTDDIIRSYLELILNLTNIKNDQDKADIKDLLFSAMNMSSNNFFSFHVMIYRKLQCLNDYANIKSVIERDLSLKNSMKRCRPLLIEVFDMLKLQQIINISQLTENNFKKLCQRRGIKMTENQIHNYYKVLIQKPKDYEALSDNLRKELDKNKNLKNNIEKNVNEIRALMEEFIKEGINYVNIDFDKFREMCKNKEVKMEYFEIEELYNLIQKYYFDFISYVDNVGINKGIQKYDENLEIKSFKLDTMARIDSQPLPVVSKLSQFH